jgi:hypothetical protein
MEMVAFESILPVEIVKTNDWTLLFVGLFEKIYCFQMIVVCLDLRSNRKRFFED